MGTCLFSSYQNKKYASILAKWQLSKKVCKIIPQMTDGAENPGDRSDPQRERREVNNILWPGRQTKRRLMFDA
jgi:hypothetical protein